MDIIFYYYHGKKPTWAVQCTRVGFVYCTQVKKQNNEEKEKKLWTELRKFICFGNESVAIADKLAAETTFEGEWREGGRY